MSDTQKKWEAIACLFATEFAKEMLDLSIDEISQDMGVTREEDGVQVPLCLRVCRYGRVIHFNIAADGRTAPVPNVGLVEQLAAANALGALWGHTRRVLAATRKAAEQLHGVLDAFEAPAPL